MKFNTLLIITSFFFNLSLFAQEQSEDFELTWSSPKKYKDNLYLVGAKKTDDGYLVFDKETIKGPGGWRYYIEFFNNNMEFVKKVDISEQVDEKNYVILDILNYGDNFLLITSRTFKSEKREEIYIQKIGESGEKVIGKRVKIHDEEIYGRKVRSSYRLTTSPNNTFLLVQVIPSKRKKHNQNLSLILLDENLDVQWREENIIIKGESEESKERFAINNIIINDLGVVYFLGKEQDAKSRLTFLIDRDRMGLSGYDDEFYKIYKLVDGVFTDDVITLDKPGLKSMDIQLSLDNILHCVGYFTANPKEATIEGVASFVLASDLSEIKSESYLLFDKEFYLTNLNNMSSKNAEKARKRTLANLRHLVNEQIMRHKDGSITLIGEIQYYYTYTTGFGENQTTHTKYVYGDLFVSHIDNDGEIISNTLIRKSTEYSRPTPKHNLMFSSDYKLVRISQMPRADFEDADPNKNKKDDVLTVSTVNEEGETNDKALFDFADNEDHKKDRFGNIATNGVVLQSNEVIILVGHSKNEYKFLRVKSLMGN